MLKKAIMVIVPVAAAFALCLFFALDNPITGTSHTTNTAALLQQVQGLSQLVTVKYVLQKVVDVRDSRFYGDNHLLLVATGIVKAGINLGNLRPTDIEISDKKITLTLPHPAITDVYLDDKNTQVLERTTGLLRAFDKDLEQNTRQQAVDELRTLALDNLILKEAQDRAQAQVEGLLHQIGFTDVEVRNR